MKPFVMVKWDDAWQDQDNFSTAHGITATHGPMLIETIGWLIQDDDLGISVVNERSNQDGHDVFRGRTFIPRAMVRQVIPFNLTRPRKIKLNSPETPKADPD
jgi:hypothetical protein